MLLISRWRDARGGKVTASMELARLTFDEFIRQDLVLGGGVWATRHFWYWTWREELAVHSSQVALGLDLILRFVCWPHHAGSLDGFRQVSSIGLTPEHVTLKLLGAAVYDQSEGVAVMADTQKGEKAYLAFPERLLPLLSKTVRREMQSEGQARGVTRLESSRRLPVPSIVTGRYRWHGWLLAPTRLCRWSSWCSLLLDSVPPSLHTRLPLDPVPVVTMLIYRFYSFD